MNLTKYDWQGGGDCVTNQYSSRNFRSFDIKGPYFLTFYKMYNKEFHALNFIHNCSIPFTVFWGYIKLKKYTQYHHMIVKFHTVSQIFILHFSVIKHLSEQACYENTTVKLGNFGIGLSFDNCTSTHIIPPG